MDFYELPSTFIEIQLASVTTFNIRFSHHIMKIDENLQSILNFIEEPYEELENTVILREKRISAEFFRRFTRDYLYPTHLKMNELEKEYLSFIGNKNCKIAQSMILRPLVLMLLKKLSSSTQAYLQFVRKTRCRGFVKLKELLHSISHFLEIITSVVDHRILKMNDIEKLCSVILAKMNCEKHKFKISEIKNIERRGKIQKAGDFKKPILNKTSDPKSIKRKVRFTSEPETKEAQQSKQIHHCNFQTRSLENVAQVQSSQLFRGSESYVSCIENDGTNLVRHNSISNLCLRISDLIVNELITEVVNEMNECFQCLALNVFDLEFKN